jgi:hypothetical protein
VSRKLKFLVGIAFAASGIIICIVVANGRAYVSCRDLLGERFPASIRCRSRRGDMDISFPKSDLSKLSRPIRELNEGAKEVIVKGYPFVRDPRNSNHRTATSLRMETYWWREVLPGRDVIRIVVVEDEEGVIVVNVHQEIDALRHLRELLP